MKVLVKYLLMIFLWSLCSGCKEPGSDITDNNTTISIGDIAKHVYVDGFVDQMKLWWDQHDDSYTYEVRYAAEGTNMDESVSLGTNSSGFLLTELETNQIYDIQIRFHDGHEWSDWSDMIKEKTAGFKTKVTTYNVLSAQYDHLFPGSTWADRKLAIRDVIMQPDHNPDILTVQELMDPLQAEELTELLAPVYDGYVSDKDISARGIFWKLEMYRLIESGDIEILGDDISGYSTNRNATYVHLQHIASQKELMVFNVHLPWGSNADAQHARHRGADHLSEMMIEMLADTPVVYAIIPGDYNNYPETVIGGWPSSPQTFSDNGLKGAFNAALNVENRDYGTTNDILAAKARVGENGSMRVDYIFAYPGDNVAVSDYQTIINFQGNSNIDLQQPVPSDHHPVSTTLHFTY